MNAASGPEAPAAGRGTGLAATAARIGRGTAGLAVGFAVAVPELLLVLLAGGAVLGLRGGSRAEHPAVAAVARLPRAVARWEFHRIARGGGIDVPYAGTRPWLYLAVRPWLGILAGIIGFLIAYGAETGVAALWLWLRGGEVDGIPPSAGNLAYLLLAGVVMAFLSIQGLVGVAALERLLAARLLGPSREQQLAERVSALTASRAAVVEAVDAERRRIERDLHDGVQQRTVALGMLLGRARRGTDPDRRDALLEQAHEAAQLLLSDLREVSWRIFPAALESDGLAAAIESVVERSAVPVALAYTVEPQPRRSVATAAYFTVCEAVTNAAKHSGASRVDVSVTREPVPNTRAEAPRERLTVVVRDDGRGGADARGGGLSGLARRVTAVDGTFTVDSPPGGPTTIRAELPCD